MRNLKGIISAIEKREAALDIREEVAPIVFYALGVPAELFRDNTTADLARMRSRGVIIFLPANGREPGGIRKHYAARGQS